MRIHNEVSMQYEVKALRGNEGLMMLSLEAADAIDAGIQAKALGYTVLATKAKQRWPSLLRRRARFPLVLFSQELVALLKAGLPLIESIEALAEKEDQPDVRKTLTKITSLLYE